MPGRETDTGLKLTHQRMLRGHAVEEVTGAGDLGSGWFTNTITLNDGQRLTLSSKYDNSLPELAAELGINWNNATEKQDDLQTGRKVEFA